MFTTSFCHNFHQGTPAPTVSSMPTVSNKPTSSPSISSSPTTSPKPTPLASDSPSAQPSISAKVSIVSSLICFLCNEFCLNSYQHFSFSHQSLPQKLRIHLRLSLHRLHVSPCVIYLVSCPSEKCEDTCSNPFHSL